MRREVFGFAGALVLGTLFACSGGAGTPDQTRGPDGEPASSTDTPGNGREGPNTPGESPGNSANEPAGACFDCSGTYACTSDFAGSTVSDISLEAVANGCATVDDQGAVDGELVCGGQFLSIDNGQTTLIGSWSGGTGHFIVRASLSGQTINVDCVLTNNPQPQPQPQPVSGTGSSNSFDGG